MRKDRQLYKNFAWSKNVLLNQRLSDQRISKWDYLIRHSMPAFGTQQFDTWNVKKRIISDDFSLYNTFAIFTKHQKLYQGWVLLCYYAVFDWLRTCEVVKGLRGYHGNATMHGISCGDGCSGLSRAHYGLVGSPVWNLWSWWSLRTN